MCFGGGGDKPQILGDKPDAVTSEQTTPEVAENSDLNSKRSGRSALRIDLNPSVKSAGNGTGLNVG